MSEKKTQPSSGEIAQTVKELIRLLYERGARDEICLVMGYAASCRDQLERETTVIKALEPK